MRSSSYGNPASGATEYYSQQYNARASIPDHPHIFTRWQHDSALVRRTHAGLLDLTYGTAAGERLDHGRDRARCGLADHHVGLKQIPRFARTSADAIGGRTSIGDGVHGLRDNRGSSDVLASRAATLSFRL